MISLKCDSPIRIRNKYTGDWMFVNCRRCPSCKINEVNTKCVHLLDDIINYPYKLMVTLTYDNEHLPYMCVDDNRVFRGVPSRSFPVVLDILELDNKVPFETYLPSGFSDGCFTGVLYYKDFQNFIKRLRINLTRKYGSKRFKFHSIGEYGTSSKRPHFHVLFYGREEFGSSFRNAVIESWKLHDWSKLELEKVFEYAEKGVCSYLTSYVNRMCGDDGFLYQKAIRPKTFRSKALDFSVDKELLQTFQAAIRRGFCGRDFEKIDQVFGLWDCSQINNFSLCLVPSRIISSYFGLPTTVHRHTWHNLYECYTNCIRKYFQERRKGQIEDFSSYRCYLSFKKYCDIRNIHFSDDSSLMDFVLDSTLVNGFYKSCQLRLFMCQFDGDLKAYKDACFNTKVDDLNKRDYWLLMNNLEKVDEVNSPGSFQDLQNYKSNYKYKLLPKHLHGYINGYNI